MANNDTDAWHNRFAGLIFTNPPQNYLTTNGNPLKFWYGLSRINLLVGPNNSGKSKLLRQILTSEVLVLPPNLLDDPTFREDFLRNASPFRTSLRDHTGKFEVGTENPVDLNEILGDIRGYATKNLKKTVSDVYANIFKLLEISHYLQIQKPPYSPGLIQIANSFAINELARIGIPVPPNRKTPFGEAFGPLKIYVPVLRGLRTLDETHTDFYENRTKGDYSLPTDGRNSQVRLFTGIELHSSITKLLLGTLREREDIAAYQRFLSTAIFDGEQIALIPAPKQQLVIKIGREKEQEIQNLGDGLQSIIALTYLPFLYDRRDLPSMFFMEEPELFLHPGSQRRLLEVLTKLNKHIYFITTHSNHLLDLTIDYPEVTVTSIRKSLPDSTNDEETPKFTLQPLDDNLQSSLALLGIRNSSVFLVNATIWVEGITDRWYFRKMLELYMGHLHDNAAQKKEKAPATYREDTHYSFVEYGGANIVHFSFLDSEEHPINVETLCGEALVILDQDGNRKNTRQAQIKAKLGDNAMVLTRREVENLLSPNTLKKVIADIEGLPLNDIPEFTYESYKDEYLGEFIEVNVIQKLKVKRNKSYTYRDPNPKATGTIRYKVPFSEKARSLMTYEDLSKDARALAKKMYDHISKHNGI